MLRLGTCRAGCFARVRDYTVIPRTEKCSCEEQMANGWD